MDSLSVAPALAPLTVGDAVPEHNRMCMVCAPAESGGLGLRLSVGAEDTILGRLEVTGRYQGAPGTAHGGLLAAVMDELLGSLNWLLQVPAVTARLEVDYVRPVPVGSVLQLSARLLSQEGRKVRTSAEARFASPEGPLACRAAGLFVQVPLAHRQA